MYDYQKDLLEEMRNSDDPFERGFAIILSTYINELKTQRDDAYDLLERMSNVLEAYMRDAGDDYEPTLEEWKVFKAANRGHAVESSSDGCTNRGHAVESSSDGWGRTEMMKLINSENTLKAMEVFISQRNEAYFLLDKMNGVLQQYMNDDDIRSEIILERYKVFKAANRGLAVESSSDGWDVPR